MLVRLVYASRSRQPVTESLIADILDKSRRQNQELGLTGVLCVCPGDTFIQVLEGSREDVNAIYTKIVRDDRHQDVTLLHYAEIDERRFSGWRMGRADLAKVNPGVVLRFSEKPQLDPLRIPGRVAVALLEELMSSASILGGSGASGACGA